MSTDAVYYAIDVGNRSTQGYNGKDVKSIPSIYTTANISDIKGFASGEHGYYVRYNCETFVLGADSGTPTYETHKPRVSLPYFLALIAQEKIEVIDVLYVVDSLPTLHQGEYERSLKGEHQFQYTDAKGKVKDKTVVVRSVKTIKEGYGAIKVTNNLLGDVLVFNNGGGTFDAVTFRNGVVDPNFSINLKGQGALEYSRMLQVKLRQSGIITFNIPLDDLFTALENDCRLSIISDLGDESVYDISLVARQVGEQWFTEKFTTAIKELGGRVPTRNIIITGGLANLLKTKYSDKKNILIPENPETANVRVF